MKTKMMRTLAGLTFMGFAAMVNAQDQPAWTTSKDVQKVANKQLFEDETLRASHINAAVMSPTTDVSKGVHQTGRTSDVGQGNVASVGAPDMVVSKGVHQISRKPQARKPDSTIEREEQITRNGEQ